MVKQRLYNLHIIQRLKHGSLVLSADVKKDVGYDAADKACMIFCVRMGYEKSGSSYLIPTGDLEMIADDNDMAYYKDMLITY